MTVRFDRAQVVGRMDFAGDDPTSCVKAGVWRFR